MEYDQFVGGRFYVKFFGGMGALGSGMVLGKKAQRYKWAVRLAYGY